MGLCHRAAKFNNSWEADDTSAEPLLTNFSHQCLLYGAAVEYYDNDTLWFVGGKVKQSKSSRMKTMIFLILFSAGSEMSSLTALTSAQVL